MTRASLPPVAVIGAGFSGTMAALQLLSVLPPERPVLLCERAGIFGRGLAYGTGNPAHLLNLRATNMSAFPDRPGHFEDWLGGLGPEETEGIRATPAGTFAARGLYGRYLTELLSQAVTGSAAGRLRLLPDAVTDLEPRGDGFRLHTEGGAVAVDDRVGRGVLAALRRWGHRVVAQTESYSTFYFARPQVIQVTGDGLVAGVDHLRPVTAMGF